MFVRNCRVIPYIPMRSPRSTHVPIAERSTSTRHSRPSEDHHPMRRTFTIPTEAELRAHVKTAFLRVKTGLHENFKGCLKTSPISPEYPLDRLRNIQGMLNPALRGKALDEDPVFVRNYLIDTYTSHQNSAEGFAVGGICYGTGSLFIGGFLFLEGSPLVGLAFLTPNVLLWMRSRYHLKITDQIRDKILLVEQKLRDTYTFNSFLHYKPGECTHKYTTLERRPGDKV